MHGSPKPRGLEERTFLFAQTVRTFVKTLPRTVGNAEDVRQLVRASGSVAANWIEADEALSKKDFLMRAKICRKEAKESRLFLRLLEVGPGQYCIPGPTCCRGLRIDPDFLGDHFKEQRIMTALFALFGNWDLPGIWALGSGISI